MAGDHRLARFRRDRSGSGTKVFNSLAAAAFSVVARAVIGSAPTGRTARAFRSIVVPLKAIVLNLLSVGAAYGVLVLVFQHHWAEPLLGFTSNGSIISWLPLFLFVVLFGLSLDYHVFILSRVREGVDSGMSSDDAVRYGITHTAGVVTSAALVMFAVFSIFGSLSSLDVKEAGVGLAAAVLIDATIVRAVLLPASMKLLGDWNWYLPRVLERLPRTIVEAPGALARRDLD
ncbi:MAG TPA: MMPL family transporter [Gaiellaceae bacterium]